MMTKIETSRLFLRELTPEDFDALYAVLADSDIRQHYPCTFDEAREQIHRFLLVCSKSAQP